MSESIKAIVKTSAWKELESFFQAEIEKLKDITAIDASLDNETYSREVRSRACAANMLKGFLNKVNIAGKDTLVKPVVRFR